VRFRSLLIGWTGLAVIGWLIAAGRWADQEAGCNPEYSLICFDESDIWLVTGAFTAAIWIFGVLLLTVIGLVARALGQSRGR
jgi:hypothetical protein